MEKVKVTGMPELWEPAKESPVCPGCHYGVIARMIMETVIEMGIKDKTIIMSGVTCGTNLLASIELDAVILNAHGRAPDSATGAKRALHGEPIVITIQGDGDTIAIGAESLINAALRGEKITIIMLNNTNYGTTGGQMAPTTLHGQITTTTPLGRTAEQGYVAHVAELLSGMEGVAYAARGAVTNLRQYKDTKKYFQTALTKQINREGLTFLEILSACPPNWKKDPVDCVARINNEVIKVFPLGEFKK